MSNYEATKYDYDGANLTDIVAIPTGTIVPWSAASVPTGFLECNGALVSRSTYSALFAVIGTTYGAGDGSSTFALPDVQDNVPVGKSGTKALASTGGANTVSGSGTASGTATANATLSTAQLASHSHPAGLGFTGTGSEGGPRRAPDVDTISTGSTGSGTGHQHNMASLTFSGTATSVLQPYVAVLYIIKT